MSTDLAIFLNYMRVWENQSDEEIDRLIKEHQDFVNMGDFESDYVVDKEFESLVSIATTVRDETIAADAIQISADAAAVAAIWTFGISMAYFAVAEVAVTVLRAKVSSKSKELSAKMKTVDYDISSNISSTVNDYVTKYKANNNLIASQAAKGIDIRECRAILMQFMSHLERMFKGKGGMSIKNFKKLAASARVIYHSKEIHEVYIALDELNLSDKAKPDVQKFAHTLKKIGFDKPWETQLVQGLAIGVLGWRLKVAENVIKECVEVAGLPLEEVESSAFGMIDMLGKFAAGVNVVMSVVDVVLEIVDIEYVVEQTAIMVYKLENTIKPKYKAYYNNMKKASKAYNDAIKSK